MRAIPLWAAGALALAACNAPTSPSPADLAELPDASGPPADLAEPPVSLSWQDAHQAITPGRDHHATFVTPSASGGAFLYVLGGTDHYASYIRADVQRAAVAADGTLGAWMTVSTLPQRLAGHSIAVVGDVVVVTGGVTVAASGAFQLTKTTSVAHLASDGNLGDWTAGPSIPSAREHHTTVVHDRTIYLIGGLVGSDGTTDVERAVVASDGTVGAWSKLTPLPAKRSHHAAVLVNGAIYVLGGLQGDPSNGATSLDDVLRAPLESDGTLGQWQTVSTLSAPLSTHSASFYGGAIYVIGGLESDFDFTSNDRRARLFDDGTLGAWEDVTALPAARGHVLQTPIWDHYIFSVGGSIGDGSVLTDVVVGNFQ